MPATNRGRVEQGLELLRQGLAPFIEREIRRALRQRQVGTDVLHTVAENPRQAKAPLAEWDAAALLRTMWDLWQSVFRFPLGPAERSLVSELRGHRNNWAHQKPFSSDEAYRAIDSAARLLTAVSAPQANELDALKTEMLRLRFEEQRRNAEKQKARRPLIESEAAGGLKPWREVIEPHPDVATGKYRQAEFAADLWQVHREEGADEYRKPDEFFRRTYLTESLSALLVDAARRLAGKGGDPVVELQTNFGGGKTHSMLALYHLFSGADSADLMGVDSLLADAKIPLLGRCGAWCSSATGSRRGSRRSRTTGPRSIPSGARSPGNSAGRRRTNASGPATSGRPVRGRHSPTCSGTTAPACCS